MSGRKIKGAILTVILVSLVILGTITGCNDWDGMDRTSDEFRGIQTRQAEGLR